jgi:hypothetical protein
VKKVGVRSGPASTNKVSPAGTSQLGYATGDKLKKEGSHTGINSAVPVFQGSASQVPSGNAVAASTVAGPGGSRTVYKSGYQMQHGPSAGRPKEPDRHILSEYGPDVPGRRRV